MVAILTPAETFDECAKALDKTTLRVFQQDALRMFTSLTGYRLEDDGSITHSTVDAWSHAPAVLMWSGYIRHFYNYANRICEEWTNREYGKSTVPQKLEDLFTVWVTSPQIEAEIVDPEHDEPRWLKDPLLVDSHRSQLIRQSVVNYQSRWRDVPKNLAVLWPSNYSDGSYSLRVNSSDQYQIDRGNFVVPDGTPRAKMPPGYEAGLSTPVRV